ncbi:hypothetical protein [Spirosoma arcticum]
MKRNTILSILFGLFIAVQAVAQTTPTTNGGTTRRERLAATTPEQRANRQTIRMKKQLSLTADQETTVAAINLKYAQQMQPLIANGERSRNMMKQVRDMANSQDKELKKVLNSGQYKQYEVFKDERKDRMKQNRGQRDRDSR